MSNHRLSAFLSQLRVDGPLRDRALQCEDCDSMAELARSLGYELSAAELLRFQAQWLLSRPDRDLNARPCALRVRHWGCWLDVV